MTTLDAKQFVLDYLRSLSGQPKPAEVIDRFVTDPDLKYHIELFEAAFPRYELRIEDAVADGDLVAVRATFAGRHEGPFQGIPATGKDVTAEVMVFYRVENGKVVKFWMNGDMIGLMQQLGAAVAG